LGGGRGNFGMSPRACLGTSFYCIMTTLVEGNPTLNPDSDYLRCFILFSRLTNTSFEAHMAPGMSPRRGKGGGTTLDPPPLGGSKLPLCRRASPQRATTLGT